MQFQIDNTGLHAAGRQLEGRSTQPYDISELLQLAAAIIFCERLFISGNQPATIDERTRGILAQLSGRGLERDCISARPCTPSDFAEICRKAGQAMLTEFRHSFPDFLTRPGTGMKAKLPQMNAKDRERVKNLRVMLTQDVGVSDVEELAEEAMSTGLVATGGFIPATNPELLALLRHRIKPRSWTYSRIWQLVSKTRVYINYQLASANSALYAPAVSRACDEIYQLAILKARLEDVLQKAVADLAPRSLGLPSVRDLLMERARRDPWAVVDEALVLRQKSAPLRKRLSEGLKNASLTSLDKLEALDNEVKDLALLLDKEICPHGRPRFRDVFRVQYVFLIPVPDFVALVDWVEFRWKRQHVIVLSEMARALAYRRQVPG